jgi:hypothetical protein
MLSWLNILSAITVNLLHFNPFDDFAVYVERNNIHQYKLQMYVHKNVHINHCTGKPV